MRVSFWDDYELIDTSKGERLERWGNIILIRPDPQIVWNTPRVNPLWDNAHAKYIRSKCGGGQWKVYKEIPDVWQIDYNDMSFKVKLMGFKHTGVFPEQAINWDYQRRVIQSSKKSLNVLNLFAYTGGATLACVASGANVCHVDASKGMTSWARENFVLSKCNENSVRWIVDDCIKFVQREVRRGRKYDAIIMDPPSYGRGPCGEIWKLEEQLFDLVEQCSLVLADDAEFLMLNSYTTGLSPAVMKYILGLQIKSRFSGDVFSDEIGLRVTQTGLDLPCGATAIWSRGKII